MRGRVALLGVLLGLTGRAEGAEAQPRRTDDPPTVTVAMLERMLAAFNAHDLDAIMQFFAEDCQLFMPRGKEPWARGTWARPPYARDSERALPGYPTLTTVRTGTGSPATLGRLRGY
jgi:hypothetical protein